MAKTVEMIRESDGMKADVHPLEVDNYRSGGFKLATKESKKDKSKVDPVQASNKCQAILAGKGNPDRQCGNDALEGSDFCHIKTHK